MITNEVERSACEIGGERRGYSPSLITASALIAVAALGVVFYEGLSQMIPQWSREEYSYAYIVPFISAAMIWAKLPDLKLVGSGGSWWGVAIICFGLILAVFGELSTIYTIIHYAFIVTVFGIAWALIGWRGVRVILAPLIYLAFVVPLPQFLYQGLSAKMQLISSSLGVALIDLVGISVFLDGNVIDLGTYKLQVVEACSGLRYLFPLASFGFLFAYLYNGPFWQRAILFLSTGPITILINSFRIGGIGVLVEYMGIEAAEGFLHLFEGWIIFLAGVGLLFAEMWLLARLSGRRAAPRDLLRFELLLPKRGTFDLGKRYFSRPFIAGVGVLVVAAVSVGVMPARSEIVPERKSFVTFPMLLDNWRGREQALEQIYLDVLKLSDYILANYRRPEDRASVNMYVAYYDSQRKGASIHSPRSCIPGGGWEIADLSETTLEGVDAGGEPLRVNRVIIAKGASKQIVYYWFEQRGRHLTNEYEAKWLIFWDALTRSRTDGALVRVVTPVPEGEDMATAEQRLAEFVRKMYPRVVPYIPI